MYCERYSISIADNNLSRTDERSNEGRVPFSAFFKSFVFIVED